MSNSMAIDHSQDGISQNTNSHENSLDNSHDKERNAYNAAFYELGLRWHWDSNTYRQLLGRSPVAGERVRAYLETAQAHLLKAYDADFLVEAIESRKTQYRQACSLPAAVTARQCNWAALQAGQVGA